MASSDKEGLTRPAPVERALRFIRAPSPREFESVAREVFAFQYEENAPYRAFCRRRGVRPATLTRWQEIPALPTAAFKSAALTCGPPGRLFKTSGTLRGEQDRGKHHLPELALYDAAWEEPFRRHVVPDRREMRILSLIPDGKTLPDSSLSYMVDRIMDRFGARGSGFFLGRDGMDAPRMTRALGQAIKDEEPVLLLTTAFAAITFLDELEVRDVKLSLPKGSRIMDTGGFKNRAREVARDELLHFYEDVLGVPPCRVVGEYGMTEMCSQFYETTLCDSFAGKAAAERLYEGPPWVRTRVLDPDTLEPVPDGREGLLAHLDLANAWSVCSIVTEDLGMTAGAGFRLLGRAQEAELRGCSLAAEELLGE
jgi:hypothetical protein